MNKKLQKIAETEKCATLEIRCYTYDGEVKDFYMREVDGYTAADAVQAIHEIGIDAYMLEHSIVCIEVAHIKIIRVSDGTALYKEVVKGLDC